MANMSNALRIEKFVSNQLVSLLLDSLELSLELSSVSLSRFMQEIFFATLTFITD